ncbi:MAG: hypothetical protein FJ109_11835 [Deltaproteobacteria bacterium]|nr:hypothetical protein [Deltaproteobacteria bacterium]
MVPRSLYLAQLEDRLGPGAVAAVTTAAQVAGALPQVLNSWSGKGLLPAAAPQQPADCPGIAAGGACCPASCGVCGGKGCGALPGGASNCCSSTILESGKKCSSKPPPCILTDKP